MSITDVLFSIVGIEEGDEDKSMEARLQDQVGQSEIIPPANCSERIFGGADGFSSGSIVSAHP